MSIWKSLHLSILLTATALLLGGCASKPLMPYTTDTPPLALVPAIQSVERDKRGCRAII